jgi:xanthine dehydrogenase/oxidase
LISQDSEHQTLNGQYEIKGRFEIGAQYHYTMETQTCVCVPNDEGMDVYSSTQWIDNTQVAISDVLGVPENRSALSILSASSKLILFFQ